MAHVCRSRRHAADGHARRGRRPLGRRRRRLAGFGARFLHGGSPRSKPGVDRPVRRGRPGLRHGAHADVGAVPVTGSSRWPWLHRWCRRWRSSVRTIHSRLRADIEALRTAWSGRTDCEIVVVEDAEHGFVHDPDRESHAPKPPPRPGTRLSNGSAENNGARRGSHRARRGEQSEGRSGERASCAGRYGPSRNRASKRASRPDEPATQERRACDQERRACDQTK